MKDLDYYAGSVVLGIRTDTEQAEIVLLLGGTVHTDSWIAGRSLATTLLAHIDALLRLHDVTMTKLSGIVVYAGPGSFTGLRIGVTVANTLAYSLQLPISAQTSDDWFKRGSRQLIDDPCRDPVLPEYGQEAHVTL
jgi:tRNA threonylcarbamoyladenosine biosynthesis protein TsaB